MEGSPKLIYDMGPMGFRYQESLKTPGVSGLNPKIYTKPVLPRGEGRIGGTGTKVGAWNPAESQNLKSSVNSKGGVVNYGRAGYANRAQEPPKA